MPAGRNSEVAHRSVVVAQIPVDPGSRSLYSHDRPVKFLRSMFSISMRSGSVRSGPSEYRRAQRSRPHSGVERSVPGLLGTLRPSGCPICDRSLWQDSSALSGQSTSLRREVGRSKLYASRQQAGQSAVAAGPHRIAFVLPAAYGAGKEATVWFLLASIEPKRWEAPRSTRQMRSEAPWRIRHCA